MLAKRRRSATSLRAASTAGRYRDAVDIEILQGWGGHALRAGVRVFNELGDAVGVAQNQVEPVVLPALFVLAGVERGLVVAGDRRLQVLDGEALFEAGPNQAQLLRVW